MFHPQQKLSTFNNASPSCAPRAHAQAAKEWRKARGACCRQGVCKTRPAIPALSVTKKSKESEGKHSPCSGTAPGRCPQRRTGCGRRTGPRPAGHTAPPWPLPVGPAGTPRARRRGGASWGKSLRRATHPAREPLLPRIAGHALLPGDRTRPLPPGHVQPGSGPEREWANTTG